MKLSDYINQAIQKAGSRRAVAELLGIHPDHLSGMKAGTRNMPDDVCIKLAIYLGLPDPLKMIAIKNASRAKNYDEEKFWELLCLSCPLNKKTCGTFDCLNCGKKS